MRKSDAQIIEAAVNAVVDIVGAEYPNDGIARLRFYETISKNLHAMVKVLSEPGGDLLKTIERSID